MTGGFVFTTEVKENESDPAAERQKVRSAAAYALLREKLGGYLGVPPESVEFSKDGRGKPSLPRWPDVHISVSHTEGLAAVAFARAPVGVDVERVRPLRLPHIAGRFFTPEENAWLRASEDRERDFFVLWMRKEAWLKATGTGLSGLSGAANLCPGGSLSDLVGGYEFGTEWVDGGWVVSWCVGEQE